MRIDIVISSLRCGGAERVASTLAGALAARDHAVRVITESTSDGDHYRLAAGVKRESLCTEWQTSGIAAKVATNLKRLARLRAVLLDTRPDCVVSMIDTTNVRTLLATAGTGLPVVVSERTDPRQHQLPSAWRHLRRLTYGRARSVVVQTESVAQWARGFLPPQQVWVIPNPLPELPTASGIARTSTVVTVGRMVESKGFDVLLRAFAASGIAERGWRLAMLGDGPERARLQKLADELAVQQSVDLPGTVLSTTPFLRSSSIFAMTSRYEGFPNALLEAMAAGLPCIAFDCPSGPSEMMQHGRTGLLLTLGDERGLVDALQALADDPGERDRLGEAARKDAENRYSQERIAVQWERVMERAARSQAS